MMDTTQKGLQLNRGVSIVGVGYTPFGLIQKTPEIKDFTERELISMAFIEALKDAGLEAKDVDAFFVAVCRLAGPAPEAWLPHGGSLLLVHPDSAQRRADGSLWYG